MSGSPCDKALLHSPSPWPVGSRTCHVMQTQNPPFCVDVSDPIHSCCSSSLNVNRTYGQQAEVFALAGIKGAQLDVQPVEPGQPDSHATPSCCTCVISDKVTTALLSEVLLTLATMQRTPISFSHGVKAASGGSKR